MFRRLCGERAMISEQDKKALDVFEHNGPIATIDYLIREHDGTGEHFWEFFLNSWRKIRVLLDDKTIKEFNKLIEMRRKRDIQDNFCEDPGILFRYLISKEIQYMKDEYPLAEDIKERNKQRLKEIRNKKTEYVYCPMYHQDINNLMICMSCPFGHMTECHYPFDCNSPYCNHYKNDDEVEPL